MRWVDVGARGAQLVGGTFEYGTIRGRDRKFRFVEPGSDPIA
jgi:hypothetical protein